MDNRHVYINDIIDQEIAEQVVYHIARYNIQDKNISLKKTKADQIIHLFSWRICGMMDFVLLVQLSPVELPYIQLTQDIVIVWHFYCSSPEMLGMECNIPTYLLHEGEFGSYNSDSKATDEFEFNLLRNAMIKEYVLKPHANSSQEYEQKPDVKNWYMVFRYRKRKKRH